MNKHTGARADVFTDGVSYPIRVCGEKPDGTVTETSSSNTMEVIFFSDFSHVDRGFEAEFQAVDASDRKRLSSGLLTNLWETRLLKSSHPQPAPRSSSAKISVVSNRN